jgi:putative FmdB family regulatory protein
MKIFELMVKLKDADKEVECPDCKGKLRKIIAPVAFRIAS